MVTNGDFREAILRPHPTDSIGSLPWIPTAHAFRTLPPHLVTLLSLLLDRKSILQAFPRAGMVVSGQLGQWAVTRATVIQTFSRILSVSLPLQHM